MKSEFLRKHSGHSQSRNPGLKMHPARAPRNPANSGEPAPPSSFGGIVSPLGNVDLIFLYFLTSTQIPTYYRLVISGNADRKQFPGSGVLERHKKWRGETRSLTELINMKTKPKHLRTRFLTLVNPFVHWLTDRSVINYVWMWRFGVQTSHECSLGCARVLSVDDLLTWLVRESKSGLPARWSLLSRVDLRDGH